MSDAQKSPDPTPSPFGQLAIAAVILAVAGSLMIIGRDGRDSDSICMVGLGLAGIGSLGFTLAFLLALRTQDVDRIRRAAGLQDQASAE